MIPSMRTLGAEVARGRWRRSVVGRSPMEPLAVGGVAVLARCTAAGPAGEAMGLELLISEGFAGPGGSTMGHLTGQYNVLTPLVVQD
jgi:hypothetical protein